MLHEKLQAMGMTLAEEIFRLVAKTPFKDLGDGEATSVHAAPADVSKKRTRRHGLGRPVRRSAPGLAPATTVAISTPQGILAVLPKAPTFLSTEKIAAKLGRTTSEIKKGMAAHLASGAVVRRSGPKGGYALHA